RGPWRARGGVRRPEHGHRLRGRPLAPGVEKKTAGLRAGARVDERPEQVGGGGERYLPLRLVADDAEDARHDAALGCLGEKPALPSACVADDDGRHDLAAAGRADELVQGGEFVCASDERTHVLKRTSETAVFEDRARGWSGYGSRAEATGGSRLEDRSTTH